MDRETWDRIAAIFHAALDMPAEERDRYVTEHCAGDAKLRAEVCELLAGHEVGPLDALGAEVPREILVALPGEPMPGSRVGAYRIVDRIGRGGMGVVYRAERDDPELPQRVALKLLRGGIGNGEPIGRFLGERRILSRLEHPNITRLLDGGVTSDGTPFFAMEYVDGQPIDRYCDDRRLNVRDRISLFLRVCDAMQYAHSRLVVHRDVKPSNILVTRDGTVKVLDFGIAKLLDDTDQSSVQTRTGLRWLTPEYASPEQVRGEPVTTASDVYSLGVVLYELLTGARPYGPDVRGRYEIERAVLDSEPSKPSVAVAREARTLTADSAASASAAAHDIAQTRGAPLARLRRQLAGDIDTIVLKALQKEPDRRYGMAGELAADLRRHLAGLPVVARPDTLRYRAGKFVRRNKVPVAATAMLVVALAAGAAGTATQARRAERQAQLAATQAATAEQVSEFLVGLFEAADPFVAPGEDVTARDLLERGAARLREQGDLAGQPAVRAKLLYTLGRIYTNLGGRAEARPLLEEALALRRSDAADDTPSTADVLAMLGALEIYEGRPDAARTRFEEALDLLRTMPDSAARPHIATALAGLAGVHLANAEPDTAEALLRRAIALRRGHDAERAQLAGNLNGLGVVLGNAGNLAGADSAYTEALDIQRSLFDPKHPDLARTLNNIATLKHRMGDAAAAESHFREALAIWRDVLGRHPDVATALNNLGAVLEAQGKFDDAEASYRESLALKRELVAGDHPSIASSLNNLGLLLARTGRYDEAEPLLTESLAMRRRILDEDHPDVARALHNLADLHERQGRLVRAEDGYQRALDIRRSRLGPGDPQTLGSALALARVRHARGNEPGAAALLDWILDTAGPALPAGDPIIENARALRDSIRAGITRADTSGSPPRCP